MKSAEDFQKLAAYNILQKPIYLPTAYNCVGNGYTHFKGSVVHVLCFMKLNVERISDWLA